MALPEPGYLTNVARIVSEVKAAFESWLGGTKQLPGGAAEGSLTIASGVVRPAVSSNAVATEGAAGADDLTNIDYTDMPDGSIVRLRAANAAQNVVIKHAAGGNGQVYLSTDADFTLDVTDSYIDFQRRGTAWYEVGRSGANVVLAGSPVMGQSFGLFIRSNGASSPLVHLEFQELVVASVTGDTIKLKNQVLEADLTASGAGGRTSGTLATANTGYCLYVYANGTGACTLMIHGGVINPEFTNPLSYAPTGYNYFALVGYFKSNTASTIIPFWQSDQVYRLAEPVGLYSGIFAVGGHSIDTFSPVGCPVDLDLVVEVAYTGAGTPPGLRLALFPPQLSAYYSGTGYNINAPLGVLFHTAYLRCTTNTAAGIRFTPRDSQTGYNIVVRELGFSFLSKGYVNVTPEDSH